MDWSGPLNLENAKDITTLLHQLLAGKTFTFVEGYKTKYWIHKVTTGVKLLDSTDFIVVTQNEHQLSMYLRYLSKLGTKTLAEISFKKEIVPNSKSKDSYFDFSDNKVTITGCISGIERLYVLAIEDQINQVPQHSGP